MWILKLELDSQKQFLGQMAIKHNITISGYPLSSFENKNTLEVINCGLMFGNEINKKKLFTDLKKSTNVKNIESNRDFVIIHMSTPKFMKPFFNPEIIQIQPVFINPKIKKHIWVLGSFRRELLEKVIDFAKKHLDGKILKFKEEKIDNVSITSILPNLSKKQYNTFNFAISKGYYDFPRKISMKELAKLQRISYSTFQEHLKRAESKIIPSFVK